MLEKEGHDVEFHGPPTFLVQSTRLSTEPFSLDRLLLNRLTLNRLTLNRLTLARLTLNRLTLARQFCGGPHEPEAHASRLY